MSDTNNIIIDDSQFDIQLRKDLETARSVILGDNNSLLEFDFIANTSDFQTDIDALNSINNNLCHTYNLLLLLLMFICAKWLFDKTILCFNTIWKGV